MSENWTTENIPNLSGKVAIVTGANSGIGFETAKEFARNGAQTILACRSIDKARAALNEIRVEIPNAPAEIMKLDLASLESVHAFTAEFLAKYDHVDILVNNAGIMMIPYGKTADGFEKQFGTNHLGHFALTGLLLDTILATPGARVINVSSGAHQVGNMNFDDLMYENGEGYSSTGAYGRSKLANLLFTYELQRRLETVGADAIAVAAHPGSTNTNLQDEIGARWYVKPFVPLMRLMMQNAAIGALPTIRAAVDPNVKGGQYYGPDGFLQQRGYPEVVESNKASHNTADARRLWEVSEELTGVHFEQLSAVPVA
jgi:NAD(P)-dependent dehydrogenase (short-subunit alcohol dehydrogenase family)